VMPCHRGRARARCGSGFRVQRKGARTRQP
jgi:hypothetical protein